MDQREYNIMREKSQDVVCNFVEGIAFGNTLGVALRSLENWWTVKQISQHGEEVSKIY